MSFDEGYWIKFFNAAGIEPSFCRRYAEAFVDNRIRPDMMPMLNVTTLRDVGILPVGDCILILKHGNRVCHSNGGFEQKGVQAQRVLPKKMPAKKEPPTKPARISAPSNATAAATSGRLASFKMRNDLAGVRLLMKAMDQVNRDSYRKKVVHTTDDQMEVDWLNSSSAPLVKRTPTPQKQKSVFERIGNRSLNKVSLAVGRRLDKTGTGDVFSRLGPRPTDQPAVQKPILSRLGVKPRGLSSVANFRRQGLASLYRRRGGLG